MRILAADPCHHDQRQVADCDGLEPAQCGHHLGALAQLEDQMCAFTNDFDRGKAGYSPDRVDALVWALSELLVEPMAGQGIFEAYRRLAKQENEAP